MCKPSRVHVHRTRILLASLMGDWQASFTCVALDGLHVGPEGQLGSLRVPHQRLQLRPADSMCECEGLQISFSRAARIASEGF